MHSTKLFTVILISLAISGPLFAASTSKYHQQQQTADALYEQGEYAKAMKQYLPLAKKGDTFSQYRVSYMYLEGQGMDEEDLIESYAWATLAAQNKQKELEEFRNAVGSLVPLKKHRKALRRVDYYTRKWGNLAIAKDASKGARREIRNCTGSRVGTRCEDVYAMQMPKFWGISPGHGGGAAGDGGSAAPSGSVSSAYGNGAGGATQDVAYYQQLRQSIRDMDRYIQENSGTVEIGEFEVLEDKPVPKTENDNG